MKWPNESTYSAFPLTRGENMDNIFEKLGACVVKQGNLPWVSYTYAYIESSDTYNIVYNDSELHYASSQNNSVEIQHNTIPGLDRIHFLIKSEAVPGAYFFTPYDERRIHPPWFDFEQNEDFFRLFAEPNVGRQTPATICAKLIGMKTALVRRLPPDYACPICLSPARSIFIMCACGHPFHWRCVWEILLNAGPCPICRLSFDNPSVFHETNFSERTIQCACDECIDKRRHNIKPIPH
jgi:hypothetical protein